MAIDGRKGEGGEGDTRGSLTNFTLTRARAYALSPMPRKGQTKEREMHDVRRNARGCLRETKTLPSPTRRAINLHKHLERGA